MALRTLPYRFGWKRAGSLMQPCLPKPPVQSKATTSQSMPQAISPVLAQPLTKLILCSVLSLFGHHCLENHALEGTVQRRYRRQSSYQIVGKRETFSSSCRSVQSATYPSKTSPSGTPFAFLTVTQLIGQDCQSVS